MRLFLGRLLRRLYPAYLLFLVLAAMGYYAKHLALRHGAAGFRSSDIFAQDPWVFVKNLLLVQDIWPRATLSLNYPSWAISDFVWVVALVSLVCAQVGRRARAAALVLLALAGYAGVVLAPDSVDFNLARCAASFITGMAAARLARAPSIAGALGGPIALAGLLGAWALMQFDGAVPHPFAWMPLCAALMVIGLGRGPESLPARIFSWPPLVALGRLAYTFILAHALVLITVDRALERLAGVHCSTPEHLCERGLSAAGTVATACTVLVLSIVLSAAVDRLVRRLRARPRATVAPQLEAA